MSNPSTKILIVVQHDFSVNCNVLSFGTPTLQQVSTLDTTETSTKFDPQKCCSILKEKEDNTTASAMVVDIIFENTECFILQIYKFLLNQRFNTHIINKTLTRV